MGGTKGVEVSAFAEGGNATTPAKASATLHLGKKSGDNYIVQCSLKAGTWDDLKSHRTATMVAWKQVCYKTFAMYKQSSYIIDDGIKLGKTEVTVENGDMFNAQDDILVIDSNNTDGENATVSAINGNVLTLANALTGDFHPGNPCDTFPAPPDVSRKLAAVVKKSGGVWQAPALAGYLTKTFGGDTLGADGGCFVEFKPITGGIAIPLERKLFKDGKKAGGFAITYLPSKDGIINLVQAQDESAEPGNIGQSLKNTYKLNTALIYCQTLLLNVPVAVGNATKAFNRTVSHEVMHVMGVHWGVGNAVTVHCQHPKGWDNSVPCIMKANPVDNSIPVEDLITGNAEATSDELYQVRDSPTVP